jgi:hypothetical protein
MSDQQMAELYERISGARSNQATAERVFLCGWNCALDFAIKQMRISCDEVIEPADMPVEQASREVVNG